MSLFDLKSSIPIWYGSDCVIRNTLRDTEGLFKMLEWYIMSPQQQQNNIQHAGIYTRLQVRVMTTSHKSGGKNSFRHTQPTSFRKFKSPRKVIKAL